MSGNPDTGAVQTPDEIRLPTTEVGVIGWLNHNLFSSKLNGILTIVLGIIVVLIALAIHTVYRSRLPAPEATTGD